MKNNIPQGEHPLEELDKLRKLEDGTDNPWYVWYCAHVLPQVYGWKEFKEINGATKKIHDFFTISDEAFGLVCLHNSWDCWKEEAEWKKNNPDAPFVAQKTPKYTMTQVTEECVQRNKKSGTAVKANVTKTVKTWSLEGRTKYNEIGTAIKKDRKKNLTFDDNFFKMNAPAELLPKPQTQKDYDNFDEEE